MFKNILFPVVYAALFMSVGILAGFTPVIIISIMVAGASLGVYSRA